MGDAPPLNGGQPRVTAVVLARDEWPLLGVAVVHALRLGFDDVVVLDHASTDESPAGLATIAEHYDGRLRILRSDHNGYHQEAATALLIETAVAGGADWVYVFDADEFLLIDPARTIHEVLAAAPTHATAVRYEVHNWIAPHDFDDTDLHAYRSLRHRAAANAGLPARIPPEERRAALASGEVNFFAFPFKSKLIVRATSDVLLAAGSHELRWPPDALIVDLPPQTLRAAHLPMLSPRRVAMRVERGALAAKENQPAWFGWHQNGVTDAVDAGGADRFWADHSVQFTPDGELVHGPAYEIDDAVAEPIGAAAEELANYEGAPVRADMAEPIALPVDLAVAAIQRWQRIAANMGGQEPPPSRGKLRAGAKHLRTRTVTGIRQAARRLRAPKYRDRYGN